MCLLSYYARRVTRKTAFCKCVNKGADQLRGKTAQLVSVCFRYIARTIPLISKSEILEKSENIIGLDSFILNSFSYLSPI